jgi:hypothetical protein
MSEKRPNHPEPVAAASQLAVLPFLSAVEGLLKPAAEGSKLRITMHRLMAREGEGYLQQLCTYLGSGPYSQQSVGRMFTVDTGIIGRAFDTGHIYRTRHYATRQDLQADLEKDLVETNNPAKPDQVPVSYLAIPFIGTNKKVALILYAECDRLNFFADDRRVEDLVRMGQGFCSLLDWLNEEQPFPTLRNFPLEFHSLKYAEPTVFPRLQQTVPITPPPTFRSVSSFNYDVAVA